MRFVLALVAAVASTASASNLLASRQAGYPNCALPCLASANFGSCGTTDLQCLCSSNDFVSSVTDCITGACTGDDLTNAEGAAQSECAAVGVTLTSTPAAPTSTAPSNSDSASASPSASQSTSSNSDTSGALTTGPNFLAAAAALGAAVLAL